MSSYRSQGACVSDMINMLVSGTYYAAVIENCTDLVGRVVVVDVGASSGILSLFAALVGAKHVYAVEASEMPAYACKFTIGRHHHYRLDPIYRGRARFLWRRNNHRSPTTPRRQQSPHHVPPPLSLSSS
ncbi:hypothetical protein CsSME_00041380 [Camellia sinensis var. sinensis]